MTDFINVHGNIGNEVHTFLLLCLSADESCDQRRYVFGLYVRSKNTFQEHFVLLHIFDLFFKFIYLFYIELQSKIAFIS